MPVFSARNLSKAYGPSVLLSGVSITVTRGERVGLVGINGTGKSTLLRLLAGLEAPDAGFVERRRDATVAYLAQEPLLDARLSPRQIVESGLARWREATDRYAEVARLIAESSTPGDLLMEQARLTDRIEQLGGWDRSHVVDDMLGKLGVLDADRPVGSMSGGERRRVAIAQILVAQPSLAILDEPTNHLDADTITWLEEYLVSAFAGAVLVVTHDRYFLDALCDRIVELDRGTLREYRGGYGNYVEQKAERLAHEDRVEQNRLNLLRRERAWLLRGAKARTTKQKARIERAEAAMAAAPLRAPSQVALDELDVAPAKNGRTVLDVLDADLDVGGNRLVNELTLHLQSGERVGIIGRNGVGKTSLLRLVAGELTSATGTIQLAPRTRVAFFDQARAALRNDWSVYENVAERQGARTAGSAIVQLGDQRLELTSYLEHFAFDGAKQRQPVGSLSGGERARVALAKILKSGANLLLLDEPTNDLDVDTLSALEELLLGWPGSALIVSHDRGFLDRVATSLLVFEAGGRVVHYAGNYTAYRAQRALAKTERSKGPRNSDEKPPDRQPVSAGNGASPSGLRPLTYAERLELDGLMDAVSAAEAKTAAIEQELAEPDFYAKRGALAPQRASELAAARAEVARLIARWEELETRRDAKR